ncbi:hypothetical protein [Candidatus Burkholderia verschuerenii]|uniref:hypothetical protein n=1 Tax=Candidatus Burkholderia verschuerenii TaxID=242163 RepID=UPI00067C8C87|nr:hypothetical protein [Candidatus Burkholderia verschuerenii]
MLDFYVAGDVSKYRLARLHGAADAKPIMLTCLTQSARVDNAPGRNVAVRWDARDAAAIPDTP